MLLEPSSTSTCFACFVGGGPHPPVVWATSISLQGSGYLEEREDHSGALQEEVHEFWIQGTVAGDPLLKGG